MRIKKLALKNFRCFEELDIPLGQISVFIGANNGGKSSILRAILLSQAGFGATPADVRVGEIRAKIALSCEALKVHNKSEQYIDTAVHIDLEISADRLVFLKNSVSFDTGGAFREMAQFPNTEPYNPLIPYLSKRKVVHYSEEVKLHHSNSVSNMTYLAAKLARIVNPSYPGHTIYRATCEAILGFMLGTVASENGQRPGLYLQDGSVLTLSEMGEGVPNIAALLVELATAENKVFIIEEPENDLHPTALKALLQLVLTSSQKNQFVISTHSNIVVQFLAEAENLLYYVEKEVITHPSSSVRLVPPTATARLDALREMGYQLSDFDLWDGWLFLEESSAERIIRDFLVPMFVPRLSSIRTLAARGVNDVEATFDDFYRLVRFSHLEEVYRGRTWVKVDGDEVGKALVQKLSQSYTQWDATRFSSFSKPQFEYYYPVAFAARVESVLAIKNRQEKRAAKSVLLAEVLEWLRCDYNRAFDSLKDSAAEVIDFLREIEASL